MLHPYHVLPSAIPVLLVIGLLGCQPLPNGISTLPAKTVTAAENAVVPTDTAAPSATAVRPAPVSATSIPRPTATVALSPLPDLNARPLVWFSPLPPLPIHTGRPFTGSTDFMNLFAEDADWRAAAGHIQVFKLYGEWVAYHATDVELRQVVANVRQRGMALAVEAGPLTVTENCGAGIEGYAGVEEGLRIARRIQEAGGTVQLVAYDHPFDAGTLDTSANACRWTPEKTAQNVAQFVQAFRTVFPQAAFGDIVTAQLDASEIERWVDAYRTAVGEDLAFVHVDINFSWPDWPRSAREVEDMLRARGIPFGIIYFGSWNDPTDHDWLVHAGERVKAYELGAGGHPDHLVFQSWHDHPDRALPESAPETFTWFINQYFADKTALGVRTKGPGANLAYGKTVRASRAGPEVPAAQAVDGNPDTWWGASDFPPQWIEVDLGADSTIAGVNLMVSQSPEGLTTHRVLVMGAGTGGKYQLAHTFHENTADMDVLAVPLSAPLKGIRFIRIETTTSPSWVSWHEIEVIAGE